MKMQAKALIQRRMPLLIAVALGLAGCGGGGGGDVRPSNTPPPSTPSTPPAEQPAIDAHLELTNAYAAHAAGFTGAGVTIGMVDTGINPDHPALEGRVKALLVYVDPATNDTTRGDVVGHGTWTSQVAAGVPFGEWPGGIAPGADLVSARIISDTPPADDGSGQGNQVEASDADFFGQSLMPDLIANGVQVMNNSWGGLYWNPAHPATVAAGFADAFRPFVIDHDGLVVFATGNESNAQPSDTASLPYYAPDLERGWLAVAALDSLHPTRLASYSNACGKAMNYCLVAPGDVIVTGADDTANHPSYWVVSGTSFSTPEVAGGAALVWQAFPYFDNDLVRQTLLGTATDLGDPGVDPVFGYGALDVGRAVNGPAKFDWGDVTVSFSGESSWSNPISGAGGLIKQGPGTLNLTRDTRYEGLTHIEGGILKAQAIMSSVQIDAGATLGSATSIGGDVDNAGVLTVSGSDMNLSGNYTQQASGRLALELGSVLQVNGTATLAGGDLYVIGKRTDYVIHMHTQVLTAGGGLTGTFSAIDAAPNVMLTATPGYDATGAWLDVTRADVTAIQGMSYTAASYGAAQRVEGAFDQIDGQLAPQGAATGTAIGGSFVAGAASLQQAASLSSAQRSLESLSGQLHAASAAMTFEAIDAGTRALSDRFDSLLDTRAAGGWMQNLGYRGGMSRSGYSPVGYELNGTLAGQDVRVGASGVVGIAASQSQGLGRLAESADQGRSHAMEGMLYGGLVRGNAYVMGRVGMGHYRETMRRHIELGYQVSSVASESTGGYDVAYGESGYRLALDGVQVTPYVDLQYARIQRGGFSEPGAYGFGLKASGQTVRRWQAGAGVRAARQWSLDGGGSLRLQARLLWQQSFGMRGDVFDASFTGVDQWAPLGGIGLSRYGGVAGVTLDWNLTSRAALQFGMDQHFAQRERGSLATLNYHLSF
jgi:autotransporter-associated beta strand protein